MKLKVSLIAITIFLTCYYFFKANSASDPTLPPKGQDRTWIETVSYGTPVWIAMDSVFERQSFQYRTIILFIQPQDFSEPNLRRIFSGLAEEYNQPYDLSITAYSNREMVQRELNVRRSGVVADLAAGAENTPAYKEYANKYLPLETGYYRAYYRRINGEEAFEYSPDADKKERVQVTLKERVISYTGNPTADLVLAIKEEDTDKAQGLLSQKIDVNTRDKFGYPLLALAINRGEEDIAKALLDKGAEVDLGDSDGTTALMFAAAGGETEIAKLLLARGAEINLKNYSGYSALMFAAANGHNDIGNILLAHHAELNIVNKYGETAMMKAASKGYAQMVKALLKHGANLNIKDAQGMTALVYAKENKHEDIALLLERAGAK